MSPNFRLIGADQPDQWAEALEGLPHSYWHTWGALDALQRGTGHAAGLFTYTGPEGDRAACPFARRSWQRWSDIYTPAGFGGIVCTRPIPQLRDAWVAFAREQGFVCGYFAVHPLWSDTASAVHQGLRASHELLLLDLRDNAQALLERADRSVRRSVRDWSRTGFSYVTDRQRITEFLLAHYSQCMRDKGASSRAIWPDATLRAMCADPAVLMVGAADGEGLCAAYTFAATPYVAECHLNVSIREGKRATTGLLWWGIEQLAACRVPWLCMGGGVAPGDAIAKAKMKFRPSVRLLLNAREVYRPEEFSLACQAASTGDVAGGFFPPYRA
jgi:hypothetical protein